MKNYKMTQLDLIHDRYDFTDDGKAIIDISLASSNDLFNSFDRKTSFYKREIDQDFEDYLIGCATELVGLPFVVQINIENDYDKQMEEPIQKAIRNRFKYLYFDEKKGMIHGIIKIIILVLLGIALLTFYYEQQDIVDKIKHLPIYSNIILEGINIAAWVCFWEVITTIIFQFDPIRKNRALYLAIARADITVLHYAS